MARTGTRRSAVLLLVAFALVAGGLMEGVSAEPPSFVRRQLAGQSPLGAGAPAVPSPRCPITCGILLPTCCQFLPPLTGSYCTNTLTSNLNCGTCGNLCPVTAPVCCNGKCMNLFTDPANCGFCGSKCPTGCHLGVCPIYAS